MPKRARTAPAYHPGSDGEALGTALLNWFATHQRDLPWRRSRDPYRIWVSEVMLQQTRVETVIPYYQRWFEQFPTLQALAEAPEGQVLKAWEGLGYYSRARNLADAARDVVANYGGEVPDDPDAVADLKGVGPYTAGAILSIAFNRAVPAVDGNVMRVLSRLYLITDDVAQPATRQAMERLAGTLIPPGQANAFNQALMELGALVCTPSQPKCLLCPVSAFCRARAEADPETLPVKAKARAPRPVDVVAAVVWHEGRVLIAQRPPEGLLAGLWEFPGGERPVGTTWEQAVHRLMRDKYSLELELEAHLCSVRHVFSHLVWDLRAFTARPASGAAVPPDSERLRWMEPDALTGHAFPVAHQKILAQVLACPPVGGGLQ